MVTIHRVATSDGMVQRCEGCGLTLLDFSPAAGGSVALNEARPSFFQAGQFVTLTEGVARLHEGVRTEDALCRVMT